MPAARARRLTMRKASPRCRGAVGQLTPLAGDGAEQGRFLRAGDASGCQVDVIVGLMQRPQLTFRDAVG